MGKHDTNRVHRSWTCLARSDWEQMVGMGPCNVLLCSSAMLAVLTAGAVCRTRSNQRTPVPMWKQRSGASSAATCLERGMQGIGVCKSEARRVTRNYTHTMLVLCACGAGAMPKVP